MIPLLIFMRGGHIPNTESSRWVIEVLQKPTGEVTRKNKQLTRVYGTSSLKKKDLTEYT
jgi:threonyl-tRNA synthetase